MIIKCESCSKKFLINDQEIPREGRMVQCGNCSVIWHQMPALKLTKTTTQSKTVAPNLENKNNLSIEKIKASDGKTYKFLGSQWAELYPSGKTGLFAKKTIGIELDKITGRTIKDIKIKKNKKIKKELNPSSENLNDEKQLPDIYKPNKGLGFFGYIFVIIIISFSIIGLAKTFENDLINYFPQLQSIFEIPQVQSIFEIIDMQLIYITETTKNIITIIIDLINYY